MTYAEYVQTPEGFYDLIEGRLFVEPSRTTRHQGVLGNLLFALWAWNRERRLGHVFNSLDVKLREHPTPIVLQPDLLFISKAGMATLTPLGCEGAPDLVVEIVSPKSLPLDGVRKRALYEAYGAREYWMVLPALDQIEVLRLGEDGRFASPVLFEAGQVLKSPILPGFELNLAELFAPEEGLEEEE